MHVKTLLFIASIIAMAVMGAPLPANAGEFVVVVNAANPANPADAGNRETISRLFLKQLGQWPHGEAARPFAGKSSAPEMAAFREKVLGMSEAALATHWLSVKQKTGETPPREVPSARVMLKLIGQYPGAFGIIKAADFDGSDGKTKLLFEFDA